MLTHVNIALAADIPLAEAHARASAIEEQIRRERPELSDVVIHTEP